MCVKIFSNSDILKFLEKPSFRSVYNLETLQIEILSHKILNIQYNGSKNNHKNKIFKPNVFNVYKHIYNTGRCNSSMLAYIFEGIGPARIITYNSYNGITRNELVYIRSIFHFHYY